MGNTVFITYAHSSIIHRQKVLDFAETLVDKGILVELDQFESDVTIDGGWVRWMKKKFLEADNIIVIFDEKYSQVYEGRDETYKASGKFKGIHYEITMIIEDMYEHYGDLSRYNFAVVVETDLRYIPKDLKNKVGYIYDLSKKKQVEKLVKKLPKSNAQDQIVHRRDGYHPDFIDFINRQKEKKKLVDKLIGGVVQGTSLTKGKVVSVCGALQVGKTELIKKVVSECQEHAPDYLEVVFIKIDLEKIKNESGENAILEKLVLSVLENNYCKEDVEEFIHDLAESSKYIVLAVKGIEAIADPKGFLRKFCLLHHEIISSLYKKRFVPERSDFSIIIESRENLFDEYLAGSLEKFDPDNVVRLQPLRKEDVESAIISYLASKNKKKSQDLNNLIQSFWDLTNGLPGAIQKIFSSIEDKNKLLYSFYDKDNPRLFKLMFTQLEEYITASILSKECLVPNQEEGADSIDNTKLVKKLCVHRSFNRKIIAETLSEIAYKESILNSPYSKIERIVKDILFIGNENTYRPIVKGLQIDEPVRKLLFNYFYMETSQKIDAHNQVIDLNMKIFDRVIDGINHQDGDISFFDSSNSFYELIWHKTEVCRLKKEKIDELVKSVREVVSWMFGKLDVDSSKSEIIELIIESYTRYSMSYCNVQLRDSFKLIQCSPTNNNKDKPLRETYSYENYPVNILKDIPL